MAKKKKRFEGSLTGVFNKNFFGFLSGFLGLVFIGLISVFIASYYKSEAVGNGKALEAKTPTQQVKIDNGKGTGSVIKSFQ